MRALAAVLLVACAGGPPGSGTAIDAPPGSTGDAASDAPGGGGLVPGSLTVSWMHGSANCGQNTDPEIQVHSYNATTHILRQNKCDTFEAPFIYVLVGATRAIALDSGATSTPALRTAIRTLIGTRALLVAHSHAHLDHRAGDGQFSGQPSTTVVAPNRDAVQAAFGIATWPTTPGSYDLGGRVLDVLAIPGHDAQHIAIYDRETGILLTGDSLYPGLLFISDWATYRDSMHRLAQFVAAHPIAHVLGAHVEMTATPRVVYPYMTTHQPNEHVLPLTAAHVAELDTALQQLGGSPPGSDVVHDDFVISPN